MPSLDVNTLVLVSQTAMCRQVLMFQRYLIGHRHMDDYTIVTFQVVSGQRPGGSIPYDDDGTPESQAAVHNAILIDSEAGADVRSTAVPYDPFLQTFIYIRSPGP